MKRIRVSVCMATYNGEKYIKEQLLSILGQLDKNDEIVISDDGSTDNTLLIIESFYDKRIKLFHHKRRGAKFHLDNSTHNFEYALKQSTGDVIFLSDQDDVWLPNKVEKMLEALNNNVLVVSDCKLVDDKLNVIHPSYFDQIGVRKGIIHNLIKYTHVGCCIAFKRSLLRHAFPFPKTKVGHDLWLTFLAYYYDDVALIREPLILFRRHNDNVTTSGAKSNRSLLFKINYRLVIVWCFLKRICFGR